MRFKHSNPNRRQRRKMTGDKLEQLKDAVAELTSETEAPFTTSDKFVQQRMLQLCEDTGFQACFREHFCHSKGGPRVRTFLMVIFYLVAQTLPGTRQLYSQQGMDRIFGQGHSTIRNNQQRCEPLKREIIAIVTSHYEQLLERSDIVNSCIADLSNFSGQPASGRCYVYILFDPTGFPADQASSPYMEQAVRTGAFYVGMGQGNRIHSHQQAKTKEPRYQRMRQITLADRGYLAIKVVEGVSKFIALQLEGMLIRSWPSDHLTNRTSGSACKTLNKEMEQHYSKELQGWAIRSTLEKDLTSSAELPFLGVGGEGYYPQ